MNAPACDAHPEVAMVATCRRCGAKLCAECREHDGMTPLCRVCYGKARRGPWVRGAVVLTLTAGLVGGGAYAYQNVKAPFDYGKVTPTVRKLEAQLAAEPCNKAATKQLLSAMLYAGDDRGVIDKAKAFEARCGKLLELRSITQVAHNHLGEHAAEIAELTELVESEPENASYLGWRGVAYQDAGDDAHAIEDFEKTLALNPALADIPMNLATVYARAGRPCDAIRPLDAMLSRYPTAAGSEQVRVRIDELAKRGKCDRVTAALDRVSIPTLGRRDIKVEVRVNDVEAGVFVVDTGANTVTLTRAAAENVGLDLRTARKIQLETANGRRDGLLVTARSVDVKGLRAERVDIIVIDFIGPGIDGLLGMTYLSRFDIRNEGGAFEIRARTRPAGEPSAKAPPPP